jgi:hypothetical protein
MGGTVPRRGLCLLPRQNEGMRVEQEYDNFRFEASNHRLAAGVLLLPHWRADRLGTEGILRKMICQLIQMLTTVSTFRT